MTGKVIGISDHGEDITLPAEPPCLYEELKAAYPDLYSNVHCGFSVGDGWGDLLRDLSAKLAPLGARAAQVKEKFGGLRFYLHSETDEMSALIEVAEKKSYTICEQCGQPGERRQGGWIRTLCDSCEGQRR